MRKRIKGDQKDLQLRLAQKITENPNLPVVYMVKKEVITGNDLFYPGKSDSVYVSRYIYGKECFWTYGDLEGDVVADVLGVDVHKLTDDEIWEMFQRLPWIDAIFVSVYPLREEEST